MSRHHSVKRDPHEDLETGSPGSRRRLLRAEPAFMLDQLEFRCAHVASVLRAVQAAETPERDIEVVLETDEALVVHVNPLLFMCALSNLLYVAIKFSPDKSRVIIRSSAIAENVCIQVEDQCGGLPAPVCAAHDESSFWLGTTKRIAEALRGCLSVDHSSGVGCTFKLILPFRVAALEP